MKFSNKLSQAIEIGLCMIHNEDLEKLTIRLNNPNFIFSNFNQAIGKIWPGLFLKYFLEKFPIHIKIYPDPSLEEIEHNCNTEDKTEILFAYNPKFLSLDSASEKAIEFIFGWLNYQMLKLEGADLAQNLERNWPHDPEFYHIKWHVFELGRSLFYQFSPQEAARDPLYFCLALLHRDPNLGIFMGDEIFSQIVDKYSDAQPFIKRIKKLKIGLETDKRRQDIQNLEPYPVVEGKVQIQEGLPPSSDSQ